MITIYHIKNNYIFKINSIESTMIFFNEITYKVLKQVYLLFSLFLCEEIIIYLKKEEKLCENTLFIMSGDIS